MFRYTYAYIFQLHVADLSPNIFSTLYTMLPLTIFSTSRPILYFYKIKILLRGNSYRLIQPVSVQCVMYGAKYQRSAFKVTTQAESVKYSMVSPLQISFFLSQSNLFFPTMVRCRGVIAFDYRRTHHSR